MSTKIALCCAAGLAVYSGVTEDQAMLEIGIGFVAGALIGFVLDRYLCRNTRLNGK